MNKKQIKKWERLREQGKAAFVIKKGVIQWGLGTALLSSLILQIVQPVDPFWLRLMIALVIFPFGGVFLGLWIWAIGEKKYQKFISAKGNT